MEEKMKKEKEEYENQKQIMAEKIGNILQPTLEEEKTKLVVNPVQLAEEALNSDDDVSGEIMRRVWGDRDQEYPACVLR